MLRSSILLFSPLPALAAEADAPGLSAGSFLQAMLALAVIIALLLGTAWMARKVSGGKAFGHRGMNVVGGIALGPRERIVLVEVGETWLVIGIVPGQIRTLHQMPKGSMPATGAASPDAPFAHWLKSVIERQRND